MITVTSYLENASLDQREEYERIRAIVATSVPEFEEMISYGLPTFKYKGKPLLYFGAFKNHMSIFPTPSPVETLKERLEPYKVSKGTIQFTQDNLLPEDLITDLIQLRKHTIDNAN